MRETLAFPSPFTHQDFIGDKGNLQITLIFVILKSQKILYLSQYYSSTRFTTHWHFGPPVQFLKPAVRNSLALFFRHALEFLSLAPADTDEVTSARNPGAALFPSSRSTRSNTLRFVPCGPGIADGDSRVDCPPRKPNNDVSAPATTRTPRLWNMR